MGKRGHVTIHISIKRSLGVFIKKKTTVTYLEKFLLYDVPSCDIATFTMTIKDGQ